jgi:hypothetical protein
MCMAAGEAILESCAARLRSFVVERRQDPTNLPSLELAVFLVGAVAILGFTPNEEEVKAPKDAAGKRAKKKKDGAAGSAAFVRVQVSPATVSLVRVLLSPELLPLGTDMKEGTWKEAALLSVARFRSEALNASDPQVTMKAPSPRQGMPSPCRKR